MGEIHLALDECAIRPDGFRVTLEYAGHVGEIPPEIATWFVGRPITFDVLNGHTMIVRSLDGE